MAMKFPLYTVWPGVHHKLPITENTVSLDRESIEDPSQNQLYN